MLALVKVDDGGPVALREVAEPQPAANEVVVGVKAFALNRGELTLLDVRPEGWRPGQDIAGVVVQAAADGSGPAVGTRVVALVEQAGWAERATALVDRIAVLPDSVSFAAAATLPVAGLTALRALRLGGALLGKRVLITGASGGVGSIAVQLAVRAGAQVTGLVSQAERIPAVLDLGATAVRTTLEATDGPFDLALESVGGDSLATAIAHAADDSTIAVFGASSGKPTPISFRDLAPHPRMSIYSFRVYEAPDRTTFGADLAVLVGQIAAGSLKPVIGLEADWRDLGNHLAELRDRKFAGKAVFTIA